ncbi:efflux RND transporter permease subunit, partial [Gluconobacter kondonii]
VEGVLSISIVAGLTLQERVAKVTTSVARPVIFAICIIMLVYLPILTLEGVEGRMFRPMAETIILALLASLVFAFLGVPALCAMIMKSHSGSVQTKNVPERHGHDGSIESHDTRFIAFLRRGFNPAARYCRTHTNQIFIVAVGILLVSVFLAARLGGEFIPQLQEGDLIVTSTRLPAISLGASIREVTAIEKTLKTFPDIRTIVSNTGTSAIPTDPSGVEQTDSYVLLKPRSEWKTAHSQEGLIRAFDAALRQNNPGSLFSWSQPIQMRMDDMQAGVRSQIAIGIYGPDIRTLQALAKQTADIVSKINGAADVAPQDVGTIPYLHIDVDRTAAGRLNVDTATILDVVESLGGHVGPPVSTGDALIPTEVRIDAPQRRTLDDIKRLPVATRDDQMV